MLSITRLADDYWQSLQRQEPYYAVVAGATPTSVEQLNEVVVAEQASVARRFLDRFGEIVPDASERDLAAVLEAHLSQQAVRINEMWHIHPTTPYRSLEIMLYAQQVIAPQPEPARRRLSGELAMRIHSIAGIVREQRSRGIVLPAPAVAGARATWVGLRKQVPTIINDERLSDACGAVLEEIDTSATVADETIGMAHLPGGEEVYRSLVRQHTTLQIEPEELHRLGLEQCAHLTEQMRELRSRLGGPVDEESARVWVRAQPNLRAASPEELAATYRRHIGHVLPRVASLFRTMPQARADVRRADPSSEIGMAFGHYQPPTAAEPVGLYRFNGDNLEERSQMTAAALILHELIPGHHFHIARQRENEALHPLQQHSIEFAAFNEGWGEYASGLGWELGAYDDDWDAYGRLSHERFTAQRLVVDTALNLGMWDFDRAKMFMRANTLEEDVQITTELLRYATDLPAQGLAYRSGYLAFRRARESVPRLDVRDVHEAMIAGGAVPLPRMQKRVRAAAELARTRRTNP